MVTPYLWATTIDVDVETPLPPLSFSTQTTFSDIVDAVDGAFQVHAEGQGEQFGVFADFTFLGVSGETTRTNLQTDGDLDTRLFELAGVWNPSGDRFQGFDAFAGLRYMETDVTVRLSPVNLPINPVTLDGGDSYSDFMIGGRYTFALSDRWTLTLRGDGSWGETEGTWNASVVAGLKMKRGAWIFGYRHMLVDVATDNAETEITMSGPAIGYAFRF